MLTADPLMTFGHGDLYFSIKNGGIFNSYYDKGMEVYIEDIGRTGVLYDWNGVEFVRNVKDPIPCIQNWGFANIDLGSKISWMVPGYTTDLVAATEYEYTYTLVKEGGTRIYTCISSLGVSLLLLMMTATPARAQKKLFVMEEDSVAFFQGFSVSFDLVGLGMMMMSDHGEYEGALRVNLHDQWFPIFELGLGRANHENDDVTGITYKTSAPYFRLGMDWNLLKKKHQKNRMFAGFRYAYTNYKCDVIRENLPDPVWKTEAGFGVRDMKCYMHWLEIVFGIDAKIFGPLHLGWNVRYKRKLFHDEGELGNSWYVPGFGINDRDQIAANFNVIIDI